jgi:hypothetical protein
MNKSIEIDIEVYRKIESARQTFEETHNDILKRLLGLTPSIKLPIQQGQMSMSEKREDYNIEVSNRKDLIDEIRSYQQKSMKSRLTDLVRYGHKDWICEGARLPEGSKLRKWYRGKQHDAVIINGSILLNGKQYHAPSAAAMAVTDGTPVNGWLFWEYFDEGEIAWKKLNELRKPNDNK